MAAEFLDSLVNKGHALNHLKRYDEAISYYDRELDTTPQYLDLRARYVHAFNHLAPNDHA